MKMSEKILAAAAIAMLAGACVSTTTGPKELKEDSAGAADLNYQLGARYYRNGEYELARDRLLYSLDIDPKNAAAYSALALTYERLDNMRLATDAYQKAVRAAPKNYDVLNTYAVFLCRNQQYDEAIEYFDRAVALFDNDTAEITLTNAGVCMAQKPDLEKAEEYFRAALQYKSNYGEALIQLCLLKVSQDEYLPARAFLQRYLSSNAPSAGVLYLGVTIEEELGDERARADYANRILNEYPDSAEARKILESFN
jgi:type IV pilus assembly protein PilF